MARLSGGVATGIRGSGNATKGSRLRRWRSSMPDLSKVAVVARYQANGSSIARSEPMSRRSCERPSMAVGSGKHLATGAVVPA